MAERKMQNLAKETAIYGISSILGKFLNWLLVPLYTYVLTGSADYGVVANLYAWTALLLVILTYGMETGFFRFANKHTEIASRVYGNTIISVGFTSLIFAVLCVVFAMLLAVENGYQAALMAPTEILADQHFHNFQKLLEGMPVNLILLKGGNYKGKVDQKKQISSGEAQLIIGTHALIQKDVEFCKLGFIAIDEQHRFGVEQRALLARREPHPELLYLSATPIPRSLALTLYGDMEVSQIDEMPPNRKEVITYIRSDRKLDSVYQAVRTELQKGRQAYFVCPLVEESDKVDLVDAERLHQHLSKKVFPEFPCQLIHGRMANASKDEIMRSFKAGEIKVLISTTVIEVGVDVANATVMVVEHAERFGLAQLHQLRGRVGRGADQAFCYLIEHQPLSSMARERLATMSRTNDGFAIAEKDLELRGPGEMFGHEQSGMPQFRFANLVRDQIVLRQAREDAFEIVRSDPDLTKDEHALIKKMYQAKYSQKEELILY